MSARHIHLVPLGGMAGDMFVAAVLDAMPSLVAPVLEAVHALLPAGGQATLEAGRSGALGAQRFRVSPPPDLAPAAYPALARRIADAPMDADSQDIAGGLLRRLAEAEASVHRVSLDAVHFHEIADWDTLADLGAAGVILARLSPLRWSLDPLPLGGGRVRTRHGDLPIPAPATAWLLKGLPVFDDGIGGERVTPTGAAIAAELGQRASPRPAGLLGPAGYGAGTREIDGLANVLVAQVIDDALAGETERDIVTVVEFDIDDMSGEEIATAAARLRATHGVIDLTTVQRGGKKGRPVTGFRLLVRPEQVDVVAEACFTETSTLGLRQRGETRLRLPRRHEDEASLRVKAARRPGGIVTHKVEADDLAGEPTLALRRQRAREAES